jgi:hypothetical protein
MQAANLLARNFGLLAALALLLAGCGGGDKKADGKKPAAKKPPAELAWQFRQVRLAEPCRTADLLRQAAGLQAAAPAEPPSPAVPVPVPAPAEPVTATPPAAGETPAADAAVAADAAAAPAVPVPPAADPICVRFTAVYPEFESGLSRALLKRLNDAVEELATSPSFDERRAGSVDGTGRKLIAAWKARVVERHLPGGGPTERWYDDRKVEVIYRDAQVISLRLEEKLKAGGANELATSLYVSYSLDRIDRLSMADLFVEGSAKRLNELGEKKFRELRGIAPGRSLADAGFDFPGGYFRLSGNFAVTRDGLVFRYNPYDVGPFALGATEVPLATEQLKEVLRPRGPLGGRLAEPTTAPP